MKSEASIIELLERVQKFEPFKHGWHEGDTIPIQEVLRMHILFLKSILEMIPSYKYYYFCQIHRRIYISNDETGQGCELCNKQDVCD